MLHLRFRYGLRQLKELFHGFFIYLIMVSLNNELNNECPSSSRITRGLSCEQGSWGLSTGIFVSSLIAVDKF